MPAEVSMGEVREKFATAYAETTPTRLKIVRPSPLPTPLLVPTHPCGRCLRRCWPSAA